MYVRAKTVRHRDKTYEYLQLAEARREEAERNPQADREELGAGAGVATAELLQVTEVIAEKPASLQSLEELWADTATPAGHVVLTVFAGVDEFDCALI